jgi:poly(hydroxyalkanoate) depolymerase family esterase
VNEAFQSVMREAAKLTGTGKLKQATRLVQNALAGKAANAPRQRAEKPAQHGPRPSPRIIRPMSEVISALREVRLPQGMPNLGGMAGKTVPVPEGARFLARSFAGPAGSRDYKLYIPARLDGRPKGLIVMLHGCTQNPDDFAIGTGMNALAEAHGLLIAYPAQTRSANAQSCWNWFDQRHQAREGGEPAIIAGITREIVAEFGIDASRVFAAGLSAGGAMAAVMGVTYPELFTAIGVHSGLAYGAASDIPGAFAAMRGDAGGPLSAAQGPARAGKGVRTIIFHGDQDQTVHPSNAERIARAATGEVGPIRTQTERGRSPAGRGFTRTIARDANGRPMLEDWRIHGGGHAWSGGDAGGSYTDPQGPDASREMVRFFLEAAPARG